VTFALRGKPIRSSEVNGKTCPFEMLPSAIAQIDRPKKQSAQAMRQRTLSTCHYPPPQTPAVNSLNLSRSPVAITAPRKAAEHSTLPGPVLLRHKRRHLITPESRHTINSKPYTPSKIVQAISFLPAIRWTLVMNHLHPYFRGVTPSSFSLPCGSPFFEFFRCPSNRGSLSPLLLLTRYFIYTSIHELMGWFTDIFGPGWKHSKGYRRKAAVAKLDNQAIIAKIALRDRDELVRRAAVKRLTAPLVISQIALADSNSVVRALAVMQITDQVLLDNIALHGKFGDTRLAATAKLVDTARAQIHYAEIALTDKDWNARNDAIGKLVDQVALEKIAHSGRAGERIKAVKKLHRQEVLSEIARNDTDGDVRLAAIEKLDDQPLLYEAFKNDRDQRVCKSALSRLNDQAFLSDIALHNDEFCQTAVSKIKSQALLVSILQQASNESARTEAVAQLQDQTLLADIAKNSNNAKVRLAAAWKLKDKALAQMVFAEQVFSGNCPFHKVRNEITDENILLRIAQNTNNRNSQVTAVGRLSKTGWKLRKVSEEGCKRCGGSGVIYVNIDSAFERDVSSYSCSCGGGPPPYAMTVSCEKGANSVSLKLSPMELYDLEKDGVSL